MEKKIVVLGNSNIDLIFRTPRFHEAGETIVADNMEIAFGGKGANQAISLCQLGAKVLFITKLGNDHYAERYRRYLIRKGMDPKWILKDKKNHTGMAIIELIPGGENRIMVSLGANNSLTSKDLKKMNLPWHEIKLFLTQLETPLETVMTGLRLAKQHGAINILNPSPAFKLSSEIISLIDFIVPNEIEAQILSGIRIKKEGDIKKVAMTMYEMGFKNVVITLGSKGLFFKNKTEKIQMDAFKVKAVDTTASGDAFMGAFVYGLSKQWPIKKILKFANASGALAATKIGAQPSLPLMKDIKKFLKNK